MKNPLPTIHLILSYWISCI